MDDAKILREANHVVSMPENWHSANAEEYATRFARALIAAHERIKELEAKQAWQPIESAPRDEMFIYYQKRAGKRCVGLAYLARDGSWRDSEIDHHKQINPTHWMPLPEPPK